MFCFFGLCFFLLHNDCWTDWKSAWMLTYGKIYGKISAGKMTKKLLCRFRKARTCNFFTALRDTNTNDLLTRRWWYIFASVWRRRFSEKSMNWSFGKQRGNQEKSVMTTGMVPVNLNRHRILGRWLLMQPVRRRISNVRRTRSCLKEEIERYKARESCYPKRVPADKIYRNRANLGYCKERAIRFSGPELGRPRKDAVVDRKLEYTRCFATG